MTRQRLKGKGSPDGLGSTGKKVGEEGSVTRGAFLRDYPFDARRW